MVYLKVRNLHALRKANGKTLYYHRKTRQRLSDDPRVAREQCVLINAQERDHQNPKVGGPGSMHDLILQYQGSTEYADLAEQTRRSYAAILNWIDLKIGKFAAAQVKREAVIKLRDLRTDEGKRRTADLTVAVLSNLFRYAIDRPSTFQVVVNPCLKVKKTAKAEPAKPWPDALIKNFETEGGDLWRVVDFILNTGQRSGDAVNAKWVQVTKDGLEVVQSKTGAELTVPFTVAFGLRLAHFPRRNGYILAPSYSTRWQISTLRHEITAAVRGFGFDGYSLHGLRYNAAQRLAEAGATPHQIAAITGHKTLSMVTKYTKGMDQRRSAKEAVRLLEGEKT